METQGWRMGRRRGGRSPHAARPAPSPAPSPSDPHGVWTLRIAADDGAPRVARAFTTTALGSSGLSVETIQAVLLVVSELVTNVVRHGGPLCVIELSEIPSGVRVEVSDPGTGVVVRRSTTGASTTGRGLAIVEALSESWGVAEHVGAKTVWCEIPADGAEPALVGH